MIAIRENARFGGGGEPSTPGGEVRGVAVGICGQEVAEVRIQGSKTGSM